MRVGIIGRGTVGSAVYTGMTQLGHAMSFYDPVYPGSLITDVLATDLVFVCVPTDSTAAGDCDTSIVESVCAELDQLSYSGLVCIKSTVIPGTTGRMIQTYPGLSICCVPEFLRARCAAEDFTDNHDVLVIGADQVQHQNLVRTAHGNYPHNTVTVSPMAAEITKYFNNVHNAMEITFANIVHSLCEQLGADYQQVFQAITLRHNINHHYLNAGAGWGAFGGHCLPKDTQALENLSKSLGFNYELIQSVLRDNQRFK